MSAININKCTLSTKHDEKLVVCNPCKVYWILPTHHINLLSFLKPTS